MKKNLLIFIISLILLTLQCKSRSPTVSDIIGSWGSEVSSQNENSSNTIKVKTIFYKNGSSEQISNGVFHIDNETASFQIILGMKWYLEGENLIEELVSHFLSDLKGDEAAIKIIKSHYDNMFQN